MSDRASERGGGKKSGLPIVLIARGMEGGGGGRHEETREGNVCVCMHAVLCASDA